MWLVERMSGGFAELLVPKHRSQHCCTPETHQRSPGKQQLLLQDTPLGESVGGQEFEV